MAVGVTEIIIVLIIILILFGPKKLPQLARSIGESIREYRKGLSGQKKPKG
ncbi:twin-arginine translocase TatA/TatE family subunit [Candidatus Woesearchaeota archaeon]|nr:MAG: twin-arginine translocase TatA/TatE family subunit [Candidatus Woesearchaeota archaeon]